MTKTFDRKRDMFTKLRRKNMTEREAIKKIIKIVAEATSTRLIEEDNCEANEMAIAALEKQMPKKPLIRYPKGKREVIAICPECAFSVEGVNYCSECGQKIDWSNGDEG